MILLLFIITNTVKLIQKYEEQTEDVISENPFPFILIILSLITLIFVIQIFGLHCYLILTNQTTREWIKDKSYFKSCDPYKNCFSLVLR